MLSHPSHSKAPCCRDRSLIEALDRRKLQQRRPLKKQDVTCCLPLLCIVHLCCARSERLSTTVKEKTIENVGVKALAEAMADDAVMEGATAEVVEK